MIIRIKWAALISCPIFLSKRFLRVSKRFEVDLIKKLRLDTEKVLNLINAPDNCVHLFAGQEIKGRPAKNEKADQIVLFAKDSNELYHYLQELSDHIAHDTIFWICYPKKTGSISSDLVLMKSWDMVFQSGYRGQTSISVNDDWSGFRITNAPKKKATICDLPMEERKVEGIDFIKRKVVLPKDALTAMKEYMGLADYFYSQSFTCQKEYAMAIADAKREETRTRRIEKMIAQLVQKSTVRGAKKAAKMK